MTVVYYDVGDTVKYMSRDCEPFISEKVGVITEISSDNFDEVKIEESTANGSFLVYWSKKTKSYRPIREKDLGSIFYTISGYKLKGINDDFVEYVEPNLVSGLAVV